MGGTSWLYCTEATPEEREKELIRMRKHFNESVELGTIVGVLPEEWRLVEEKRIKISRMRDER